jgi:uncharacterized membrane protein
MNESGNTIWQEVRNGFIRGIGVLMPLGLTYWFFQTLLNWVDGILSPHLERILGREVPGLGFVTMMVLVLLVGLLTRNLVGRLMFSWFERFIRTIPVVRSVYGGIKDLFGAISLGSKSKTFRQVVLVEYPRPGLYCMGFVTNETRYRGADETTREFTNVFIPNPLNPTAGVLVLVPMRDVITLELSVEEGLKFVLSGGIVVPEMLIQKKPAV